MTSICIQGRGTEAPSAWFNQQWVSSHTLPAALPIPIRPTTRCTDCHPRRRCGGHHPTRHGGTMHSCRFAKC